MEPISLFIADVDQAHIQKTREAIAGRRELSLSGSASNGRGAFKRILAEPADILLLDLQLPGMDGATLLRALNRQPSRPVCIVCTRFYSDACIISASQCGAEYFLYKPLDYASLPEILLSCFKYFRATPPRATWTNTCAVSMSDALTKLGFNPFHRGTRYLADALSLLRQSPGLLQNMAQMLYPAVANMANVPLICVERSLRYAISTACERGPLSNIFSHRPTNRELFTYLLEQRLDLNSQMLIDPRNRK